MLGLSIAALLSRLVQFYMYLIFIYVIMSWFPISGFMEEIYRVLGSLCEPWVGVFRRIMPATGGLDFSPMVAILALIAVQYVIRFLPF
jgi:uncharacterized protein YggT (Ycf19 family)